MDKVVAADGESVAVAAHLPYGEFRIGNLATGGNGSYKDQLVLTGELNEIGEAVAANVPDSYRMGIELMAGLKLPCGFQWDINATLSHSPCLCRRG